MISRWRHCLSSQEVPCWAHPGATGRLQSFLENSLLGKASLSPCLDFEALIASSHMQASAEDGCKEVKSRRLFRSCIARKAEDRGDGSAYALVLRCPPGCPGNSVNECLRICTLTCVAQLELVFGRTVRSGMRDVQCCNHRGAYRLPDDGRDDLTFAGIGIMLCEKLCPPWAALGSNLVAHIPDHTLWRSVHQSLVAESLSAFTNIHIACMLELEC